MKKSTHPTGAPLVAALFLAIGLWMLYGIPLSSGFERIPVDEGDSRFNHYLLEHSHRWLAGDALHRDLFSPPIFFPATNTLALSDLMVGYGWWCWPLRWSGLDADTSFVLWMAAASLMNYAAMLFILAVLFRIDLLSATIGAFLFSFGIPRTAQLARKNHKPSAATCGRQAGTALGSNYGSDSMISYSPPAILRPPCPNQPRAASRDEVCDLSGLGHQQLLPQVYVLLIFAGLVLLARKTPAENTRPAARKTAFAWALMGSGAVLQLNAGFYHLWFAVFGISVLVVCGLFFKESRDTIVFAVRKPAPLVISTLFVFAASWPVVHLYLEAMKSVGHRDMAAVFPMLPRVQSWVFTGPGHWLYGRAEQSWTIFNTLPVAHEHVLGIGPLTSVLVVLGLAGWRKTAWGKAALAAMAVMLVVTLYYSADWNPWVLVAQYFPGAGAIRAVSRIALLLLIPASVALAGFIQSMPRTWIKLALMGLVVAEQATTVATYSASGARQRVDAIAWQASKTDLPFYYLRTRPGNQRPGGDEFVAQLDAMWAGLQANRPTVNGYSGNNPQGWTPLYFNNIGNGQNLTERESDVSLWMQQNPGRTSPVNTFTIPP